MSFAREGYPVLGLSGLAALVVFAAAVWRRNWSLWIAGLLLLFVTLAVAWRFRTPAEAEQASVSIALPTGAR